MRTVIVLAILIPGVFLAFTSRLRALLLYLWFAFFRPQEWLWIDITPYRPSYLLGLILVVPALLTGVFPNLTHPLSIGMVLFLLTGLIAQINAFDQILGWYWVWFFAQLALVCLLAVTIIRTPRDWLRVLAVVAGSLGFFATKAGLLSALVGGTRFAEGLAGAYVDNNAYALAVVMIMPFLALIGKNAKLTFQGLVPAKLLWWIKVGAYCSVPLCAYTVISTFSRAGFLGLAAITVATVLFHPRRVRLLILLGVIGIGGLLIPLPAGYQERLASISTEQGGNLDEDSGGGRVYFWGIAWQMALDHPLGIGMRNFGALYSSYDRLGAFGENRDVHSSHMQALSEQGFLALAVWIFEFCYAFAVAWRVRRRSRSPTLTAETRVFLETSSTAIMVSMVGFLVAGSFISAALNDLTWLTFALLAALDRMTALTQAPSQPGPPVAPVILASHG